MSPIGLVPKSGPLGRWRLIVDLSSRPSHSVNSGILPNICSLKYASVDQAVDCILHLGQGTELVKVDLKDAYRLVPVHPDDHNLLGILWQGYTYVDRALPFGLRSAPKIFTAVADAVAWSLHCSGIEHQIHYLDNFLFFAAPGRGDTVLQAVLSVLSFLGVPVSAHKTEGPSPQVTFLGILIDTRRSQLRLTEPKLSRLQSMVRLAHAAIVRPGRTFLRHLLHSRYAPHHWIRLDAAAKADLHWWLQSWNGSSYFPRAAPAVHVYSDASGAYGCGAVCDSFGWFKLAWPVSWGPASITVKPVVLASAVWGPYWSGLHICFHSDNSAVVALLRSLTSRDHVIMHLIRCLSFFAALFRFDFTMAHVPGASNVAADALSRNNMSLFLSLSPQTPKTVVPLVLTCLLLHPRPNWGLTRWTRLFGLSLQAVSPQLPGLLTTQAVDATSHFATSLG